MTVAQALKQLMEIEKDRQEGVAADSAEVVGVARLGREDQAVVFGTCAEMAKADLGGPLHSLVICAGEMHELEREFLEYLRLKPSA